MAGTQGTQEPDELKKKLVRRLAIAGALIAILLGGLALLDYLMAPEPAPPVPAVPPPAPPQPVPSPAEAPVEEKKEEPKPEEKKEEPKAEPEKTVTPLAPPPKPEAKPAVRFLPGPPPAVKKSEPPPPPKPIAAKPPVLPPIPRGYLLQVGVFNTTANAEELRAKLELAGIPAIIEARVQVGPFKTRKEALEAQEKLKTLNLGPGLLIPPKRK